MLLSEEMLEPFERQNGWDYNNSEAIQAISIDPFGDDDAWLEAPMQHVAVRIAASHPEVTNKAFLADLIIDMFRCGIRSEAVGLETASKLGITRQQAKTLLRPCLSILTARYKEEKVKSLGCTHYLWSTSNDERVCERCQDLNQKIFSWSDPPKGGHPGECVNCPDGCCRCVALPQLP